MLWREMTNHALVQSCVCMCVSVWCGAVNDVHGWCCSVYKTSFLSHLCSCTHTHTPPIYTFTPTYSHTNTHSHTLTNTLTYSHTHIHTRTHQTRPKFLSELLEYVGSSGTMDIVSLIKAIPNQMQVRSIVCVWCIVV
jgi:hypothetical protein